MPSPESLCKREISKTALTYDEEVRHHCVASDWLRRGCEVGDLRHGGYAHARF